MIVRQIRSCAERIEELLKTRLSQSTNIACRVAYWRGQVLAPLLGGAGHRRDDNMAGGKFSLPEGMDPSTWNPKIEKCVDSMKSGGTSKSEAIKQCKGRMITAWRNQNGTDG